jgi:hypothetical protein
MKKMFCQYCGEPLENKCDCLRELAEAEAEFIEDYENRPDVQYGWAQQDLIDQHFYER